MKKQRKKEILTERIEERVEQLLKKAPSCKSLNNSTNMLTKPKTERTANSQNITANMNITGGRKKENIAMS
jgi:hypothetical protein